MISDQVLLYVWLWFRVNFVLLLSVMNYNCWASFEIVTRIRQMVPLLYIINFSKLCFRVRNETTLISAKNREDLSSISEVRSYNNRVAPFLALPVVHIIISLFSSLRVWDRGLMTRPVSDRPRSWSYTFGLASNTVVPDKMLCDTIMLKCNKHLCSFVQYRNSAKRYWSSLFDVFCTKLFFDNKYACCNRRDFSVMYSCCCLTGLGLDLNILVLFPSLLFSEFSPWLSR